MAKSSKVLSGGLPCILRPVLTFSDLATMYRNRRGTAVPSGSSMDSHGGPGGTEWDGGLRTPEQVCAALERGWDAGNLAVSSGLDVVDMDEATTGGWDLDVAGDYCSVPDYLTGTPECMYRKCDGAAPVRVRVVMFSYMCAGVPASAAIEFAKANAAFVAILMAKGYDVAVTSAGVVASGDALVIKPVAVKEYGQEPDASRIAFASHPAFLRRAMFCAMEYDAEVPVRCRSGGYGRYPYRAEEGAMRAALGPDTDGERMVLLPDIQSLNYHGGHEAMLAQMLALIADQVETREEDRL